MGIVFIAVSFLCAVMTSGEDYGFPWEQKVYIISGGIDYYFDEFVTGVASVSVVYLIGALLYISHFLRSGRARDFYCSTPHSVGTIWLNFAAAAYAWNLIGITVAHVLHSAVMLFRDVKTIGLCLQGFAGNVAFSLMIFGMVVLAITLTGKLLNALITMLGLALLPSMIWGAFHASALNYYTLFNFVRYPQNFTCPDPFAFFVQEFSILRLYGGTYNGIPDGFALICSGRTILYCLIMSVLYLAADILFASVRTGDTAGRPFINQAAHFVSLMAVMLPIFCWGAAMLANFLEVRVYNYESQLLDYCIVTIMGIVAFLAIYWICELALTFDPKHSHHAYKYLPVPVVIALALAGVGYLVDTAEFTTTVEAAEVESFSLVRNNRLEDSLAIFRMSDSYGRTITEDADFTDAESIKYITAKVNDFVKLYEQNPKKAYRSSPEWLEYDEYGMSSDGTWPISIRLNLKNGRQITRVVKFDEEHVAQLVTAITNDKEYMSKFLALPSSEKINIGVDLDGLTSDNAVSIYDCFVKEYNALSDEQKLAYLKMNLYSDYSDSEAVIYRENISEYDGVITTEEQAQSVVSESDIKETNIKLVSKSVEIGQYYIDNCIYYDASDNLLDGNYRFDLTIIGYADGHLYESNYRFDQPFEVDNRLFPQTVALLVKTCNAKIPEVLKDLSARQNVDGEYDLVWANYYTKTNYVELEYDLVPSQQRLLSDVKAESQSYWQDYYYDEDYDSYESFQPQVITVDSTAMMEKLLADAEATGDSIDFTKPYCRVKAMGGDGYIDFFVQTEFEVIK